MAAKKPTERRSQRNSPAAGSAAKQVSQSKEVAAPGRRRPLSDSKLLARLMTAAASDPRPDPLVRHQPKDLAPARPLPGVVPRAQERGVYAQDQTPYSLFQTADYSFSNRFPGYPYLAELLQIAEYRKMDATLAEEMTREWIKFISVKEGDRSKKLAELTEEFKRLNVRGEVQRALELEAGFGRCHLYIETKVGQTKNLVASDDPQELRSQLMPDPRKLAKGGLVAVRYVEATWCYPGVYNSTDPLKANYYVPEQWYVMGKLVHHSRLRTLISNPVPDLLKAAYSFGGVSLNQLAEPYVNNWLRTRQSVSDIIHCFSTSGLATDLEAFLAEGCDVNSMGQRAKAFNFFRDNKGMFFIDKDSEEFFQFNVPLGSLDHLQAQSQEHMSAVSGIPLVKLLGITPSGLNASSDGELRVYYDFILSRQEKVLRQHLKFIMELVQVSLWGAVDPGIDFMFVPLYQLSELEQATMRKTEADTDAVLIQAGVIDEDEARNRVANDEDGPYAGLSGDAPGQPDVNALEQPQEEEAEPSFRTDRASDEFTLPVEVLEVVNNCGVMLDQVGKEHGVGRAWLGGSYGKLDPKRLPDRRGVGTSDIDLVLSVPKSLQASAMVDALIQRMKENFTAAANGRTVDIWLDDGSATRRGVIEIWSATHG